MKKLLLLSGYSGSGKNYIANILQSRGWKCLALADHLKDVVSIKYKIDRGDLDTQEGKMKINSDGKSYRQILIDESVELKKFNKNFFVELIIKNINNSNWDKVVISDWRFPNEFYELQRELNTYTVSRVRIYREVFNIIDDISESSLEDFDFDYTLYNDDSIMSQLDRFPYT